MSLKMLLVVFILFFSCQKHENFTRENLIGKWQSTDKEQSTIILDINKNSISRLENGNKIVYNSYTLSGDTLILVNTESREKHVIEILTDTKLRFGAVNPYQKDIELMDAVEFIKK